MKYGSLFSGIGGFDTVPVVRWIGERIMREAS